MKPSLISDDSTQAIQGVGIDWTFADESEQDSPFFRMLVRLMAVGISIGGMLITALMLGIVSGDAIPRVQT